VVSGTVASTYSGDFAFGGNGFAGLSATNGTGPLAFAGRFTATPPIAPSTTGSLSFGEMDTNTPGAVTVDDTSVSGIYQPGLDSSHCTLSLSSAGLASQNYSVYPISGSDAFLIETDTASGITTTPYLTAGEMVQQIGQPFVTQGVLSGTMVGGLTGQLISGGTYTPEVQVVQIAATSGTPSMEVLQTDNQAGTVFGTNGTPVADSYTSDSLGRIQGSVEFNSTFSPVLYLINTDQAFCVSIVQNAPTFGYFAPQSAGPFTAETIQSTSLVDGTSAPAVSADRDLSGFLSFDGRVYRNLSPDYHREYRWQRNYDFIHSHRFHRLFLYCLSHERGDDYDHAGRCGSGPNYYWTLARRTLIETDATTTDFLSGFGVFRNSSSFLELSKPSASELHPWCSQRPR
jgi:hypothetical protein